MQSAVLLDRRRAVAMVGIVSAVVRRTSEDQMKLFEVVAIFDVEPLPAQEDEDSYNFRIEITKEVGQNSRFFAYVYRRESYRIQPRTNS
jgi:hypothetical protein